MRWAPRYGSSRCGQAARRSGRCRTPGRPRTRAGSVKSGVAKSGHRSVTVKVGKGAIPAGDTMILAFSGDPRHGTALGAGGRLRRVVGALTTTARPHPRPIWWAPGAAPSPPNATFQVP